ncbi:NAD+ diphosphatase [Litoreibacter halocynthiae]|uniref:NAD(+) diphosphatase n=1 Tax=Litoreibacter halocynthiae TaxID=1242689 RepID=A0A4R7LG91_9RHOB|nr:NAD(+) diphosphatase [Litoreibacter halocynthiae]TDT72970.1 NAD+ diphosphatase [Litoreibacter halocynthiae]
MKLAETVTFGGSGLDRAAHLRGDTDALSALLDNPDTGVLPVWRGKPLIGGEERNRPAWQSANHPIFSEADEAPIFLGLDDGVARFARDISGWEPDENLDTLNQFLDPSEQHFPGLPDDERFSELRAIMTHMTPRDAELITAAKAIGSWHETHGYCARCGAKSTISMAGWQRDCDACGAHHFPRTDPVVIMLVTLGNSVLMGRSPGWPEGMYSCLAGFVEPGETIEAAVRRETFEESGIRVGEVEYLSSQPWPFPASLMFGCRGHALNKDITIDPEEIEDAIWVTREEMMETFAGNNPKMKAARKGAIAHFLLLNWLRDTLD